MSFAPKPENLATGMLAFIKVTILVCANLFMRLKCINTRL